MTLRHCLALEIAALLAGNSAQARSTVLGVVVEADRVHLNAGGVSVGATVYDGDRFATERGGLLLLRGHAAMLELTEESVVTVRSKANGAQSTEAELDKGTLVFSAARTDAVEIAALGARIRPLTGARTVAQVSVDGLKELRIYARRGSLQFSYGEEMETMAEGTANRVILDPADDTTEKKDPVKDRRKRKAFLLIAISGAGAGAGVAIYEHQNHGHKHMESPDRP